MSQAYGKCVTNDFSEVECNLIGRYLVTLPLSGFEGEKEILIFSVDEAGNEVEINLEIVYDTISPEVSIDLIWENALTDLYQQFLMVINFLNVT